MVRPGFPSIGHQSCHFPDLLPLDPLRQPRWRRQASPRHLPSGRRRHEKGVPVRSPHPPVLSLMASMRWGGRPAGSGPPRAGCGVCRPLRCDVLILRRSRLREQEAGGWRPWLGAGHGTGGSGLHGRAAAGTVVTAAGTVADGLPPATLRRLDLAAAGRRLLAGWPAGPQLVAWH
jgi:hypothetical protein